MKVCTASRGGQKLTPNPHQIPGRQREWKTGGSTYKSKRLRIGHGQVFCARAVLPLSRKHRLRQGANCCQEMTDKKRTESEERLGEGRRFRRLSVDRKKPDKRYRGRRNCTGDGSGRRSWLLDGEWSGERACGGP